MSGYALGNNNIPRVPSLPLYGRRDEDRGEEDGGQREGGSERFLASVPLWVAWENGHSSRKRKETGSQ
jgi:hypothetical protein